MHPADEECPDEDPDQGRQPSPLNGDDRPYNRSSAGNGFELIPVKDVLAGGHELHAIHVHLGRRRPFRVSLNDLGVDVFGVDAIADEGDQKAEDDDVDCVHDLTPFFCLSGRSGR